MWVHEAIAVRLFVWLAKLLARMRTKQESHLWAQRVGNSIVCFEKQALEVINVGGLTLIKPAPRITSLTVFLS